MNALSSPLLFLINALFGLYLAALIIRFLLGLTKANFHNPICQAIIAVTRVPLIHLRRFISPIKRIDMATVVWVIAIVLLQLVLQALLSSKVELLNPPRIIIDVVYVILGLMYRIYLYAIIAYVILGWVSILAPNARAHVNDILRFTQDLIYPIMRPLKKLIPNLGAIDITPLIAILLLQAGWMLLTNIRMMYLVGS